MPCTNTTSVNSARTSSRHLTNEIRPIPIPKTITFTAPTSRLLRREDAELVLAHTAFVSDKQATAGEVDSATSSATTTTARSWGEG
ncbi:hypothetical protein IAQ61_006727 [Plenodomus lingam]|uniref:uncharacterized protein n=1 Tax=Leptosphaeria maculans TaxID=5022 RepID=UPI0033337840|nr:hypothetical protein IAQ61_006727 [Plenodomus lingam]